jgi:hypothetical protein
MPTPHLVVLLGLCAILCCEGNAAGPATTQPITLGAELMESGRRPLSVRITLSNQSEESVVVDRLLIWGVLLWVESADGVQYSPQRQTDVKEDGGPPIDTSDRITRLEPGKSVARIIQLEKAFAYFTYGHTSHRNPDGHLVHRSYGIEGQFSLRTDARFVRLKIGYVTKGADFVDGLRTFAGAHLRLTSADASVILALPMPAPSSGPSGSK